MGVECPCGVAAGGQICGRTTCARQLGIAVVLGGALWAWILPQRRKQTSWINASANAPVDVGRKKGRLRALLQKRALKVKLKIGCRLDRAPLQQAIQQGPQR